MNKIILVVDDEPMVHELLEINLGRIKTPVEIHNALTGEEGVELYKKLLAEGKKPDLVIMDLNLSGEDNMMAIENHMKGTGKLDGVRTTEKILKIDPEARIWGYTAWFDTEWSEKLKEYTDKVVGRITPFHEFSQMVDMFFQQE
ncbi:MAG: hypothetical protein DRN33_03495 [Thermoplasmata archaeon]|jgi:DNA-binding NarL/FixJ family response regulator|nr:MAG: response regulator [Thermoplasmata archaeon]RLF63756.1 MAG: hypothetical protein DRN33_03495 [Thermoplasmata archaeon]